MMKYIVLYFLGIILVSWFLISSGPDSGKDGGIRPVMGGNVTGCSYISNPGSYFLSGDIVDMHSETCININSSHVVLDCRNHKIEGAVKGKNTGIQIFGAKDSHLTNVTVRDCYIQGWVVGIRFLWIDDSLLWNVHTNHQNATEGIGILGMRSNRVTLEHISVNDTGDGSLMRGSGMGFNNVNDSVIRNFVVSWTSDIGVIPNGWSNVVENGELWYCSRGLACSYPTSQNNTFRNITVHIMRHSNRGIGRSVIDLGEATGCIIPHRFYNNFFNKSGPNGEVDFIEDGSYGGKNPGAIFSIEKSLGRNVVGGDYIAGNYWAGRGDAFSDTCADEDSDGICDSGFEIPCEGSCNSRYVDYSPLT